MRKRDSELRITIIGMGNLMEAIFPCIVETIGQENLARQVNATTADEADCRAKEERLGIKIVLNDNMKALKELEPDIIFFAPPPKVAPGLIQGELKEYFEIIRRRSSPLPEIYAFPPVPPGTSYNEILGEDIFIVNILPNMIRTIGGRPCKGEGTSTCTFSTPWPQERVDRLRRLLSPLGRIIELKPEKVLPFLGGGVMIHVLPEVALSISEMLKMKGEKTDHQSLANYMRARIQEISRFRPERSDPCTTDAMDGPLQSILDAVILTWHEALIQYYSDAGFSQEQAVEIVNPMMDFLLHVAQGEPKDVIERNTKTAATRGGLLEKGIQSFHESIEPLLKNAVKRMPDNPSEQWRTTLLDRVRETAHVVRKHGMTLSG